MAGDANRAGAWKIFKSITSNGEADWAMTHPRISWLFVPSAIKRLIDNRETLSSCSNAWVEQSLHLSTTSLAHSNRRGLAVSF
jgi:hypothetical protein